jgi:pyruvyltransferase
VSRAISLFWWRWKYPLRLNFGDELTAPLLERITHRRVEWASMADCDVVGAGSVLQMVPRVEREIQPAIWGSGFISPPAIGAKKITGEVRAVRGARTREYLRRSDADTIALGDPGLLAGYLLDGPVRKKFALGLVPHYKDAKSEVVEKARSLGRHVRIINVEWTPEEVAREIASCEAVLSSSLHGLVFSDALEVPNAHVKIGDGLVGGLFKFEDYDSAVARQEHRIMSFGSPRKVKTVVQAVQDAYVPVQNLAQIQDALIKAIPAA